MTITHEIKSILSFEKIVNGLKEPSKIYNFLKALLFDVKIREQSLSNKLNSHKIALHTIGMLASIENGLEIREIASLVSDNRLKEAANRLGRLLSGYGSDKSSIHNYHYLYAQILLDKVNVPVKLLEIGLGTNNIDVLSNMCHKGRPGASLRAFRDFDQRYEIYGADVDSRVLFNEDRIKTYFVDQVRPETFDELRSVLSNVRFNVMIDDGLHTPEANLNFIAFAIDMITSNGVIVIEDIKELDIDYWVVLAKIMGSGYECVLWKGIFEYVFVATKRGDNNQ